MCYSDIEDRGNQEGDVRPINLAVLIDVRIGSQCWRHIGLTTGRIKIVGDQIENGGLTVLIEISELSRSAQETHRKPPSKAGHYERFCEKLHRNEKNRFEKQRPTPISFSCFRTTGTGTSREAYRNPTNRPRGGSDFQRHLIRTTP